MNSQPLTPEEQQALLEALGEAPTSGGSDELRRELKKDFALIEAALAPVPPMPAHILKRLQSTGDAEWEASYGLEKARGKTGPGDFTVIRGGATGGKAAATRRPMKVASWIALAAMFVVLGVVTSLLLRGDATQPTFAWTNADDQLYDVWVLPPEGDVETVPALFVAKNVRSPVSLKDMVPGPGEPASKPRALEKEKPHRLLVCLATVGKFGGDAVPFTPGAKVEVPTPKAADVLNRLVKAGRIPEAQKVLEALPESVRDEEAVREIAKKIPAR